MSAQPVPLPPEALLTVDEFMSLPEDDRKLELHHGVVVDVSPASVRHSKVQKRVVAALEAWCAAQDLSEPLPEYPCELPDGRLVVPDVAYVADPDRQEAAEDLGRLEGPPDLAVEIVSPRDSRPAVRAKIQDYLAAGWPFVWVIDPQRREATVYRQAPEGGEPARVTPLGADGVLDGGDVLPGFRLPLPTLWARRRPTATR